MKRRRLIALALMPLVLLLIAIGYCWHPRIWRIPELKGRLVYTATADLLDGTLITAGDPAPNVPILVEIATQRITTNIGDGGPLWGDRKTLFCGYAISDKSGSFHIRSRWGFYMHFRFLLTETTLWDPELILLDPTEMAGIRDEDGNEGSEGYRVSWRECGLSDALGALRVARAVPFHQEDRKRFEALEAGLVDSSMTAVTRRSPESVPVMGSPWMVPDLGMEFIPVPAGSFQMGSDDGYDPNEKPIHEVRITREYWIGKTEVTQRQWQILMDKNPSKFAGGDLPVEMVNWYACVTFCKNLTERESAVGSLPPGYVYRLPTEAEWERAARGCDSVNYAYVGSDNLDEVGWFEPNCKQAQPVAQKKPNVLGIYDLSGNVDEWCHDCFDVYHPDSVTDPLGGTSGAYSYRVHRGGSWNTSHYRCHPYNRGFSSPMDRGENIGFRVALAPLIPADQPSK